MQIITNHLENLNKILALAVVAEIKVQLPLGLFAFKIEIMLTLCINVYILVSCKGPIP